MIDVNTLGISPTARLVSRICFYLLVGTVLWTTNRLLPDWAATEKAEWEARGVVAPLIAVPLSDLSFQPGEVVGYR